MSELVHQISAAIICLLVVLTLAVGEPISAHENHSELGAGSGPAAEEVAAPEAKGINAVAAAFLRWFAGGFYLTDRNVVLMIHRWGGTALAAFAVLLVWFTARARRTPERPRTLYLVLPGLMTLAIAVQGYLGGSLMHGGIRHMAF